MSEPTNYVCKRCGHQAIQRSNLISHLSRKTPCQPKISNTDRAVLLEEVNNRNHGNAGKADPRSAIAKESQAVIREIGKLRAEIQNLVIRLQQGGVIAPTITFP